MSGDVLSGAQGMESVSGRRENINMAMRYCEKVYYKSLRGESELPLDEAEAGSRGGVEDIFIAKDQQMTALKMLHRIQEPFREVFMLRTFCDLSHRQIGELFGKTEGWARVVYHRARLMLRQAAEEEL